MTYRSVIHFPTGLRLPLSLSKSGKVEDVKPGLPDAIRNDVFMEGREHDPCYSLKGSDTPKRNELYTCSLITVCINILNPS